MKDKAYLKDTLAFIRYIHNNPTMDLERKYHSILNTIAHDLTGLIAEAKCFSPRVSGYAKLEEVLD